MAFPPLDRDAIVGCLLGQAVGDMMGLPAENLSPRRIAKLFPKFDRPRFFFGYGLASDDTEHACMTAQALLRSGGDAERFRQSLAWRLRWWFAGMPAGIGKATAKACIRLWLGWPSDRSGVKSAGNGPAMRAAIMFVTQGIEAERERNSDLETFGGRCLWWNDAVEITHRDRQAFTGFMAVFLFACNSAQSREKPFDAELNLSSLILVPSNDSDIKSNLSRIEPAFHAGLSLAEFVASLGLSRGVTGYIAHTVPVAIYAFLKHPDDYRAAIESVIRLGGDTDTVAAITGALVGIRVGKAGIPPEWLNRYGDWPRSVQWMESLADRLAEGSWRETPQPAVPLAWWAIPFRNFAFFLIVLGHVARRMLPPY